MAKKYYGSMGKSSAFPKEVKMTSYPKKGSAISEGSYVDTQPQIDAEFNKALGKIRKGRYK